MSNGRLRTLSLLLLALTAYTAIASVQAQELVAAPSLAPAPEATGLDCTDALGNLYSCLTYVEKGANLTVPDKGCCPSLAGLVKSQPVCLCKLLSSADVYGIKIDDTKALTLPTICHVKTPPVSLCNMLGIPVPSPEALSPGSSTGSGSVAPATQAAAPPSSNGGGSNSGFAALLALLTVASQAMVML